MSNLATDLLGTSAKPVRAVFFDKTTDNNWLTGWHQDRTIPVQARAEIPGYEVWSTKSGVLHVAPPINVLERMVTLKVFLDDCPMETGPIRVALGTHQRGRIAAKDAAAVAEAHKVIDCIANEGDVWAMATPILHASSKSVSKRSRRILHVDYAGFDLPEPLQWIRYD